MTVCRTSRQRVNLAVQYISFTPTLVKKCLLACMRACYLRQEKNAIHAATTLHYIMLRKVYMHATCYAVSSLSVIVVAVSYRSALYC